MQNKRSGGENKLDSAKKLIEVKRESNKRQDRPRNRRSGFWRWSQGEDIIIIRIGNDERELSSVDEHWINQQINRRKADGQTVCVRVTVREGNLDLVLATPTCGASGGGGRPPRPQEKEVFELWNQRGLNDVEFSGGNVVAFLKQLKSFI